MSRFALECGRGGQTMQAEIIDRGRGPEIKGTRITVYDVLDYTKHDWPPHSIALFLSISVEQVLAAERYIEERKEEVWKDYREMLARSARGNPPEIQAKLDALHETFMERVRKRLSG